MEPARRDRGGTHRTTPARAVCEHHRFTFSRFKSSSTRRLVFVSIHVEILRGNFLHSGRFNPRSTIYAVRSKPNADREDRNLRVGFFFGSNRLSVNRALDDLPGPPKKRTFSPNPDRAAHSAERPRTRRSNAHMSGACDYCSSAKALVFCRADSARLCLACDAQVRHATSRTPPPGAPSRRRWVAQCGRARSSAPAFRRDRASPTPSPVARTRRDRPSRERARAPVEPPPARVVAKFVARASALVNTEADGSAFSFPRIPLTRSPTSRAQVHTANHVARRHARSWLCEHCHNGSGTVRARSPERGERETHLAGLGRTLTFNPIRAPRPGG